MSNMWNYVELWSEVHIADMVLNMM